MHMLKLPYSVPLLKLQGQDREQQNTRQTHALPYSYLHVWR